MTTFTVTKTSDSGKGSLRQILADAKSGDTIKFSSSLAKKKITLTSGELNIDKDINIDGSSASGITISGNNKHRVFLLDKGTKVTLKNLIIADGKADKGGGIKVGQEGSELTLINSQIKNNRAYLAGGLFLGWKSTANIINSSFDGNDGTLDTPNSKNAGKSGGAISTWGVGNLNIKNSSFKNNKGYNGGAIYSIFSTLDIENTDFIGNTARNRSGGGAIFNDGIGTTKGKPTASEKIHIRGSRFDGNQAQGQGGAISFWGYGKDRAIVEDSIFTNNKISRDANGKYGRGGAIKSSNMGLTLRNVSIAENDAEGQGGGLWLESNSQTLPIDIINSTLSGNDSASAGGGAFLNTGSTKVNITNSTLAYNGSKTNGALWFAKNHAITLKNSIVAFNTARDSKTLQQVGFQPKDGGGNIEFSTNPKAYRVANSSIVADPRLGKLQNIKGALVHPLLANSPAIDAGVNKNAPTTDQRGIKRDNRIDSGAFEIASSSSPAVTPEVPSENPASGNQDVVIGEVGYIKSATHLKQVIELEHDYKNPVVFVSPLSRNGGDTAIARITDINKDSFEVFVQETTLRNQKQHWGHHIPESFSYLVMEAGNWKMSDGTTIEVGATKVGAKTLSSKWNTLDFDTNFKAPTVISSVQTFNNDEFVRLRQRRGDKDSIELALEKEEALLKTSYDTEVVGYLAVDSTAKGLDFGTGGIDYLANRTGNKVSTSYHNLNTRDYPHLFASVNSYNSSESVGLRQKLGSVRLEEDTSKDSELSHVKEDVAYIGFDNVGTITIDSEFI